MDWLQLFDREKFLLFTLVFARVSGLTMTAPIYGTKDVPLLVRVLLAVALALLITPTQWDVTLQYPATLIDHLIHIGGEVLVGLCLGLAVVILFSGIQLAGQMIARTSGMSLAGVFDSSTQTEVPAFSRLLLLVTLAVFVCIGGHRIVMAGLLDTFQTIPPGGGAAPCSVAEVLVVLVGESFALAIRVAAGVVVALLLSTLALGLISRTLPQLNILAVGLGMNCLLSFAVLSLTLGAAVWAFQPQIEPAVQMILDALHAPTGQPWFS